MKTDKAFLEIGGETFLARAINILSNVCENPVKVVLNQTQTNYAEHLPAGIAAVYDIYENRGALGGIHAALKNCETKYAVILAVDLPLVTGEVVEKLADFAAASNKFIAVVPRQTDERFQPLCAVYHARYCLSRLEQTLDENASASVQDFLDRIAPRFADQNKLADDSIDVFFNVNRPSDFQKIQ